MNVCDILKRGQKSYFIWVYPNDTAGVLSVQCDSVSTYPRGMQEIFPSAVSGFFSERNKKGQKEIYFK